MSADNLLTIYKVSGRRYVARNCWSECEKSCIDCNDSIIFEATNLTAAVKRAEEEMQSNIYEYGYRFRNL